MRSNGLFALEVPDAITETLRLLGAKVEVWCLDHGSGLDFTSARTRRPSYVWLGRAIGRSSPLDGVPQLVAPRPVADIASLPTEDMVQMAAGVGHWPDESNPNPACMGLIVDHGMLPDALACQNTDMMPTIWWVYAGSNSLGPPFILSGTLRCDWRAMARGLMSSWKAAIAAALTNYWVVVGGRSVRRSLVFNPKLLLAWVSPIPSDDPGVPLQDDDLGVLATNVVEPEQFIELDGQGTPRLDVPGMALQGLLDMGVPEANICGMYPGTVRPFDGTDPAQFTGAQLIVGAVSPLVAW